MTDPTVEVEIVEVSELVIHPENPRVGNVDLIAESIERNGWFGTVVAQRSTRHVLAGNHRLMAAQQVGIERVPVYWVDVDDKTARRILLADNRTAELATYDEERLVELLSTASMDDGLAGTGWTDATLEVLLNALTNDTPDETDDVSDFAIVDPDTIATEYRCPSCNYEWSGSPRPGEPLVK